MKIHYLDGKRLRRAMKAGAHGLIKGRQRLNDINVFPVPDGDTGTNMASTVQKITEGLKEAGENSIEKVSERIANSALEGARGNSGAILAQFFQGLAEGLRGRVRITTEHFSEAVRKAIDRSYEALSQPKEGTILTVIRDWGKHIQEKSKQTRDFSELLTSSLEAARKSLQETPKKLKALQKSGVVDAGAQGFVYMLEGVTNFIRGGRIGELDNLDLSLLSGPQPEAQLIEYAPEAITFRYCTEFFLYGEGIPRETIREKLGPMGDSLIVAGSSTRVRVHIHTNEPRRVFDAVRTYGEIRQQKVDDMIQQHQDTHSREAQSTIALVTDTSCDLPESLLRRYNIHMIPLRLRLDDTEYLDKVTIFPEEFYERLQKAKNFPKTSQPTPQDFLRIYQQLANRYESIISIHLAGKLSGTLAAAQRAAREIQGKIGKRVVTIDSRTTSVGLGLLLTVAGKAVKAGKSVEEVVRTVEEAIKRSHIFVSTDTVKYLVMGGRVSKSKGFLANLFDLVPVISLRKDGKTHKVATAKKGLAIQEKLLQVIEKRTRRYADRRFAIVHVAAPQIAHWYARRIEEKFGKKPEFILEAAPVLGAHGGPGAAAVAVLGINPSPV